MPEKPYRADPGDEIRNNLLSAGLEAELGKEDAPDLSDAILDELSRRRETRDKAEMIELDVKQVELGVKRGERQRVPELVEGHANTFADERASNADTDTPSLSRWATRYAYIAASVALLVMGFVLFNDPDDPASTNTPENSAFEASLPNDNHSDVSNTRVVRSFAFESQPSYAEKVALQLTISTKADLERYSFLRKISSLPRAVVVSRGAHVDGELLKAIHQLPVTIIAQEILDAPIVDADLQYLGSAYDRVRVDFGTPQWMKGMSLKRLKVHNCRKITNAGVKEISKFRALEELWIGVDVTEGWVPGSKQSLNIDGAGMAQLSKLEKLVSLSVPGTKSAGKKDQFRWADNPSLSRINLQGTAFTAESGKRLNTLLLKNETNPGLDLRHTACTGAELLSWAKDLSHRHYDRIKTVYWLPELKIGPFTAEDPSDRASSLKARLLIELRLNLMSKYFLLHGVDAIESKTLAGQYELLDRRSPKHLHLQSCASKACTSVLESLIYRTTKGWDGIKDAAGNERVIRTRDNSRLGITSLAFENCELKPKTIEDILSMLDAHARSQPGLNGNVKIFEGLSGLTHLSFVGCSGISADELKAIAKARPDLTLIDTKGVEVKTQIARVAFIDKKSRLPLKGDVAYSVQAILSDGSLGPVLCNETPFIHRAGRPWQIIPYEGPVWEHDRSVIGDVTTFDSAKLQPGKYRLRAWLNPRPGSETSASPIERDIEIKAGERNDIAWEVDWPFREPKLRKIWERTPMNIVVEFVKKGKRISPADSANAIVVVSDQQGRAIDLLRGELKPIRLAKGQPESAREYTTRYRPSRELSPGSYTLSAYIKGNVVQTFPVTITEKSQEFAIEVE